MTTQTIDHRPQTMDDGLWTRGVVALLIGLCSAGAPATAHAFSFSVEPARIELTVPAGKQRGKSVRVDNGRSETPTHLKIYVQDIIFLPDGTNDFPPAGTTEWSCAPWVKVVPEEIDIPAGETAEVRVSVSVPEGTAGGRYAMVFFEDEPSYLEEGLGVNFRIGALLSVTVPHTQTYQARLANLSVDAAAITTELFNDSNVLVRPGGKVKVFNANNKKVAQVEFNPNRAGILPRALRRYATPIGTLPPGQYRVKVEIDYGARYLLVGERTFTAP